VLPGLGRLKKVHRKARMGRTRRLVKPSNRGEDHSEVLSPAKSAKDAIAPKKA